MRILVQENNDDVLMDKFSISLCSLADSHQASSQSRVGTAGLAMQSQAERNSRRWWRLVTLCGPWSHQPRPLAKSTWTACSPFWPGLENWHHMVAPSMVVCAQAAEVLNFDASCGSLHYALEHASFFQSCTYDNGQVVKLSSGRTPGGVCGP